MVIDLRPTGLRGRAVQAAFDEVGVTVNANAFPGHGGTPYNPNGIRLGSPSVTSRGMGEAEMDEIAGLVARHAQRLRRPGGPRRGARARAARCAGASRCPIEAYRPRDRCRLVALAAARCHRSWWRARCASPRCPRRCGWRDGPGRWRSPMSDRHLHPRPTPRLGGIAMFAGFAVAIAIFGSSITYRGRCSPSPARSRSRWPSTTSSTSPG